MALGIFKLLRHVRLMLYAVCMQPRQATGFGAFVKANFESTRRACGGAGMPHKAVMSRLADQWAQHKALVAMEGMQFSSGQ